jgi:plastocyanin
MRIWMASLSMAALLSWSVVSAMAQEQDVSVPIRDNLYERPDVTIVAGSTVTWINVGEDLHTVTNLDGRFDSTGLAPGAQFVFTFTEPGEYSYLCMLHDRQDGIIRVVPT